MAAPGSVPDISAYAEATSDEWDAFVAAAPMGTLLHTRAFLGYHGDRLQDASVVLSDGEGRILGVLPAAVDPDDPTRVFSHPGATFGGIVHEGALAGSAMITALASVRDHYRDRGFERFGYAPVPSIYHRRPSDDDLHALFRLGAVRTRCDLSSAIDLQTGARLSSRRRRGLAKARRSGVEVSASVDLIGELWPIVEANLAERHGARPLHSDAEMRMLVERLPGSIEVVVAWHESEPVAGVVVFGSPRVSHAQYIASSSVGNAVGALDAVFDRCLSRAAERGARYFDFGTSNRGRGRVLNEGLYEFKSQFGGGGVAYEHYELELSSMPKSW